MLGRRRRKGGKERAREGGDEQKERGSVTRNPCVTHEHIHSYTHMHSHDKYLRMGGWL